MDTQWKEIVAEWCGESAFIGKNAAGGTVQMGSLEGKPGISPMELVLVGLAGCTGSDITAILEKKRQPPQAFLVRVRALRAEEYPKIWKEIEVTYLLWGEGIEPKAVEDAIRLSEEKYCSVGLMLGKAASIRSSYRILKPGQEA